jgi:hypothetical protein
MKTNMNALFAKAIVIWLLIAAGEILNGNFRVRFLHRRYGINRAKKISFFTGITIIYTICWYTLPWGQSLKLARLFPGRSDLDALNALR